MENTNKMNRMTADMAAFVKLMKGTRQTDSVQEIEIDITGEEDESPETLSGILLRLSGMLLGGSAAAAKASLYAGLMESRSENADEEEEDDDDDACNSCPYVGGRCGTGYGTMLLVARPGGNNSILTTDELEEELGEDLFGQNNTFSVKPVPGTEDLYYTIPEKLPVKCGKKRYYRQPAIIFGVDETSGEVISPGAKQIYAAMRYFENASVTIKTHEGRETAVFCFD